MTKSKKGNKEMTEKKYNIQEEQGSMAAEPLTLPYGKENYTPEELRTMLINDLKEFYGVKDAV